MRRMILLTLALLCAGLGANAEMDEQMADAFLDSAIERQARTRTPEAVGRRFNDWLADWFPDQDSELLPGMRIEGVRGEAAETFAFTGADGAPLHTPHAFVSFFGVLDSEKAVSSLTVRLRPSGEMSREYFFESNCVLQAALFSLFDGLSEREARGLTQLYLYDIQPHGARRSAAPAAARARLTESVVRGGLTQFLSSVAEDGAIQMTARFLGTPDRAQVHASRKNDACNRRIQQMFQELRELNEGAKAIEADEGGEEVAAQMLESIGVLRELALDRYAKTRDFALAMDARLDRLESVLQEYLSAETAAAETDLARSLAETIGEMQKEAREIC